jgi:hypothetical protein
MRFDINFICIKSGDTAGFDLLIFRINLVPPGRTRIYIPLTMSSSVQAYPQQQQTTPVQRTMSNNTYINHATGPEEMKQPHLNGNGASAHSEGYQNGSMVGRFITPGGNPIDNTQPAFPVFHRRYVISSLF